MPSSEAEKFTKMKAVSLAFQFGYIIALPIVFFLLLGKYLDIRFDASPWFKIGGVALAVTATTLWLTRRLKEIFKEMRSNSQNSEISKPR